MLKQRIVTALVLVALLGLSLTVAAPYGFPLFALAMSALVVYEWLLLLAFGRTVAIVVAIVVAAFLWSLDGSGTAATGTCALAVVVWVALAAGLFATGRFPPSAGWRWAHAVLAIVMPSACWFGLASAYRHGLVYLLSIFLVVWAADVAAYFAGRAFGRRKLAPAISPGKTWAGAVGGTLAALGVALLCATVSGLSGSFFALLERRWSVAVVIVVAFVMAVLSIVGDLFESQLKRQRGVKDSSNLLPGHGGVFDRVDALLPIVPIALLLQLA